jgi:(S)-ureidoglycine aminohydrolase
MGSGPQARFIHYLAHLEDGGQSGPSQPGVERFIFVLDGTVELKTERRSHLLESRNQGYALLPAGTHHTVVARGAARLNIFERYYLPYNGAPPPDLVTGAAREVTGEPLMGDPDVWVQKLLPETPSFDLAVNIMNFRPGGGLPQVETHQMEHGIIMLSGGGIYRLGDDWYPIQKEDVLWMGPYCPQWFGALGKENASYLLYKDWNRDPFVLEREIGAAKEGG